MSNTNQAAAEAARKAEEARRAAAVREALRRSIGGGSR